MPPSALQPRRCYKLHDVEATFCFVDLAGFSALTEAHGDDAAADLAVRFTGLVTETLAENGRLVKTIGDAVLVVSPSPAPGVQFISAAHPGCARTRSA